MGNLAERIGKRIKMTMKSFQSDIQFSLYYAFLRLGAELGGRIGFHKLSQYCGSRKEVWITDYLAKTLNPIVEKYEADCDNGILQEKAPVWVCWWSGEDTAPPLVKQCIRSIRENAGGHPVHLITRENYSQYLQIPACMLENVEKKTMGFAHLADYIRVTLLAQYGGLWLDATMFCAGPVPESCFQSPFFTCKGPVQPGAYLSNYRWVTFCLGGWKENVLFRFLRDAFVCYWEKNTHAVDYLFFDHIILLGYEAVPAIRKLIDEVPDNNIRRDDLQAAMNGALPAGEWNNIVQSDTTLYKLSWRETYSAVTPEGEESIYGYFLRGDS